MSPPPPPPSKGNRNTNMDSPVPPLHAGCLPPAVLQGGILQGQGSSLVCHPTTQRLATSRCSANGRFPKILYKEKLQTSRRVERTNTPFTEDSTVNILTWLASCVYCWEIIWNCYKFFHIIHLYNSACFLGIRT